MNMSTLNFKRRETMNICVYGASSEQIDRSFISQSEHFGEVLTEAGYGVVFGAGKYGLMGAVARGATRAGSKSLIGVVPEFFKDQDVLYDKCTELVITNTMRERKKYMEDNSVAFVMLPGSIGTFDEFFEILTLKQLGQHKKPIVIYNIKNYFEPLLNMIKLCIDKKFLTDDVYKLFSVCDTAEDIITAIENDNSVLYDKYDTSDKEE